MSESNVTATDRCQPEPTGSLAKAVQEVAQRANAGDLEARRELRRLLDTCPQIWRETADLERVTIEMILAHLAPRDRLVADSLRLRLEAVERDLLAGATAPALQLLVKRAVVAWAALQAVELEATIARSPCRLQRRRDAAERRFLRSVREVETVRKLLRSEPTRRPKQDGNRPSTSETP